MKITINAKTYDVPNELVIHVNGQQRIIDTITEKAENFRQGSIYWKEMYEKEFEKGKSRTISIECYMVSCKHCHEDLYCKNPHGMSIQLCNLGVPQCEGYEEEL